MADCDIFKNSLYTKRNAESSLLFFCNSLLSSISATCTVVLDENTRKYKMALNELTSSLWLSQLECNFMTLEDMVGSPRYITLCIVLSIGIVELGHTNNGISFCDVSSFMCLCIMIRLLAIYANFVESLFL